MLLADDPNWLDGSRDLKPGDHIAIITKDSGTGIRGRSAGLELRDTILVLYPGPCTGFIFLFRVPITEGSVIDQMIATETGALHIQACRVAADLSEFFSKTTGKPRSGRGHAEGYGIGGIYGGDKANPPDEAGRWPPNTLLVHDEECSETLCTKACPAFLLDVLSGVTTSRKGQPRVSAKPGNGWGMTKTGAEYSDSGGASRFYPQFIDEPDLFAWLEKLTGTG